MDIYFISGLGSDRRMFDNLALPEGYTAHYIDWLEPLSFDEPLKEYCQRMAKSIDVTKPFVLAGLSFGGVVAQEIAAVHPCEQVILISSIKSEQEMPWYYRAAHVPRLMEWVTPRKLLADNALFHWYFGIQTEEDRKLLRDYINKISDAYLRWSLYAITGWKNQRPIEKLFQIHGSDDHVFPVRYVKPNAVVQGGGHFMALNRGGEISAILAETLTKSMRVGDALHK